MGTIIMMSNSKGIVSGKFLKHLASVAYNEDKIDEALSLNEQWARLEETAEAYYELSLFCRSCGDSPRALKALNNALRIEGDNPEFLNDKVIILYDMAEYREALETARILAAHNNAHAPWNLIAMLYCEMGESQTGLFYAAKAISITNSSWDYEARAICHNSLGNKEQALQDYLYAISLEGDSPELWNNLALFYEEDYQFDEALNAYTKAASFEYAGSFVYFNKAKLEYNLGHRKAALNDCLHALSAAPRDAEIWNLYGNILAADNSHGEALNAYAKALSLNKDSIHIKVNHAFALEETGNYSGALKAYKEIIKDTRNEKEVHLSMILLLLKLNHQSEAKKQAEAMLALYPNDEQLFTVLDTINMIGTE
jgi:tetratricopeptide (TPR) repeat protein